MTYINVTFDSSSKKYICPACGKRRFVKLYDHTNKQYLPSRYGRCDREIKCGYFLSSKDFFQEKKGLYIPDTSYKKPKLLAPTLLELDVIKPYSKNFKKNNFIVFLKTIFPEEKVKNIILKYLIGTSNNWRGSSVFWQIDENSKVRSAKIILYDPLTGKRIKKPYPHITWYHKIAKIKDFNLSQCLFGLHLINEIDSDIISIVESEKTACIMSELVPESIWLATGSLSNLKPSLFEPIKDYNIILYPDAGELNLKGKNCYMLWRQKVKILKEKGYKVIVSDLLETRTTSLQKKEGVDIADFFISSGLGTKQSNDENRAPIKLLSPDQHSLKQLIERRPIVQKLVDTFNLYLE